jgi:hypothetical protein
MSNKSRVAINRKISWMAIGIRHAAEEGSSQAKAKSIQ